MQPTESTPDKDRIALRQEQTDAALLLVKELEQAVGNLNGYLAGLIREYKAPGKWEFGPECKTIVRQK